jgi:hypothetical protein
MEKTSIVKVLRLMQPVFANVAIDENDKLAALDTLSKTAIEDLVEEVDVELTLNSLKVESLMTDIASHLNQCLSWYHESMALEEKAVQFSLMLDRDINLGKIDKTEQEYLEDDKVILTRSSAIGSQSKLICNEKECAPDKDSLDNTKNIQVSLDEFNKKRLSFHNDHIESLKNQAVQPESPLNYGQRYKNIRTLFEIEYRDLYKKIQTAKIGLQTLFKIDVPLPDAKGSRHLYGLHYWFSQSLRKLESIIQNETEFKVSLPLKNGLKRHGKDMIFFIENFGETGGVNTIHTFNVKKEVFEGYKNIRLRGFRLIGVNTKIADDKITHGCSGDHLCAMVELPKQYLANNTSMLTPKVYANLNVTQFASAASDINRLEGDSMINATPIGEWQIHLPEKSAFNQSYTFSEIVLELVVAAIPTPLERL